MMTRAGAWRRGGASAPLHLALAEVRAEGVAQRAALILRGGGRRARAAVRGSGCPNACMPGWAQATPGAVVWASWGGGRGSRGAGSAWPSAGSGATRCRASCFFCAAERRARAGLGDGGYGSPPSDEREECPISFAAADGGYRGARGASQSTVARGARVGPTHWQGARWAGARGHT